MLLLSFRLICHVCCEVSKLPLANRRSSFVVWRSTRSPRASTWGSNFSKSTEFEHCTASTIPSAPPEKKAQNLLILRFWHLRRALRWCSCHCVPFHSNFFCFTSLRCIQKYLNYSIPVGVLETSAVGQSSPREGKERAGNGLLGRDDLQDILLWEPWKIPYNLQFPVFKRLFQNQMTPSS